jgi:NAD-dependent SIR2 family protein deacetylase
VNGTSLQVYPAAGLTEFARPDSLHILFDPKPDRVPRGYRTITASAEVGMQSFPDYFSKKVAQPIAS